MLIYMPAHWRDSVFTICIEYSEHLADLTQTRRVYRLFGLDEEGNRVYEYVGAETNPIAARKRAQDLASRIKQVHPCAVKNKVEKITDRPQNAADSQLAESLIPCGRVQTYEQQRIADKSKK